MSRRSVAIGAAAALLIFGLAAVGGFFVGAWRGRPEDASGLPGSASRGSGAFPVDRDPRGNLPNEPLAGETQRSGRAAGSSSPADASAMHLESSTRSGGATSVQGAGAVNGEPTSADFRKNLGAGTSAIRIRVSGADGEPLAGVTLEAGSDVNWRTERTDRSGVAELGRIAAGSYEVIAKFDDCPGLSVKSTRHVSVREGETVEINLRIPAFDAEIVGRVLDPSRLPLQDIQVVATPQTFPGGGTRFVLDVGFRDEVRTDVDGSFKIGGLARMEHVVSTRDCSPYSVGRVSALAGSGESVELVLTKGREIEINGSVSDPEGDPVMGAAVRSSTHGGPQVETSADGRFRLLLVHSEGGVGLAAAKDGFAKAEVDIPSKSLEEGAELEVNFTLEPLGETASLAGVIRDAARRPVPDQMVHIHAPTFRSVHQARTAPDGAFEISGVPPAADYRVWVNPMQSFRDFQQAPIDLLTGENRFDITLEPLETGRLSGVLRDGSGNPVSRWTLWAHSASAAANSVSITTDSIGRFSAEDVPCGSLTIETRASPHLSIRGLELKPEEPLEVDLVIGIGGGSLSGAVATPSGAPIARAKVALTWSRAEGKVQSIAYREAQTDAGGRFAFSGLPGGRAELTVQATGYLSSRKTLSLTGGAEEISIALELTGR